MTELPIYISGNGEWNGVWRRYSSIVRTKLPFSSFLH